MSSDVYTVSGVALELYEELGSPEDTATGNIASWILYNAGKVNNKIATSFVVSGGDYNPSIYTDEKDIIKALYLSYYYSNAARKAMSQAVSTNRILTLKDDLSSVTFVNSKDVARAYAEMAKDYQNQVTDLAILYKHNRGGPNDPKETVDNRFYIN